MIESSTVPLVDIRPVADIAVRLGGLPGGGPYRRGTPHIFGPVGEAIGAQRRWFEQAGDVAAPDGDVFVLENAVTCGGLVFDQFGSLARESLINRDYDTVFCGLSRQIGHSFTCDRDFYQKHAHKLQRAVLMKQEWDVNYGHWLIEGLPRMAPLLACADLRDHPVVLTNTARNMMQVYADSLKWFGVTREQLFFVLDDVISVERLLYPPPLTHQPWVKAPLAIRTLEALAARIMAATPMDAPKKIYVSRPPSARRPLINGGEIRDYFLARGYQEIVPAQLTFDQQVAAFSAATHVVGVLGAECANMAFSPPGIRFLGLAPELMQDDFFWDLVSLKEGVYVCAHGAALEPEQSMNSPFRIEAAVLRAALESFEGA